MTNKSNLKQMMKTLLTNLNISGLNVRLISCDNHGESMTMKNDPEV
jgi:hypothetical protein